MKARCGQGRAPSGGSRRVLPASSSFQGPGQARGARWGLGEAVGPAAGNHRSQVPVQGRLGGLCLDGGGRLAQEGGCSGTQPPYREGARDPTAGVEQALCEGQGIPGSRAVKAEAQGAQAAARGRRGTCVQRRQLADQLCCAGHTTLVFRFLREAPGGLRCSSVVLL